MALIKVRWTPALVSDEGDDDYTEFLKLCGWCESIFDPHENTRVRMCSELCRKAARRYATRSASRRRKERLAEVESEVFTREEIFDRDEWICQLCRLPVLPEVRSPAPGTASLDHIVPVARGGPHTRANVQLAHLQCNAMKNVGPPWKLHGV